LCGKAYADFDYAKVVAALASFMNVDLSAFYFDIRKDALYCDAPSSKTRREALDVVEASSGSSQLWLARSSSHLRRVDGGADHRSARVIVDRSRESRSKHGTDRALAHRPPSPRAR